MCGSFFHDQKKEVKENLIPSDRICVQNQRGIHNNLTRRILTDGHSDVLQKAIEGSHIQGCLRKVRIRR